MSHSTVFINAIRNVRVQGGLVFFELGEDGPAQSGVVSTTQVKAVMEVNALRGMIEFLHKKVLSHSEIDVSVNSEDEPKFHSDVSAKPAFSEKKRIKIDPSSS